MLRSRSCWEAHNLLKSMFCCDIIMPIFFLEMVKLKCWEAGHAEKHKICWKACFVVTWWFFFDGNGETYMKCWEADHAEKQKFCWKACFVVTCLIFLMEKNLNYWCLIGERSRNTQTGTKRYGRFIFCIYLHDTMETFFGSFLLCW